MRTLKHRTISGLHLPFEPQYLKWLFCQCLLRSFILILRKRIEMQCRQHSTLPAKAGNNTRSSVSRIGLFNLRDETLTILKTVIPKGKSMSMRRRHNFILLHCGGQCDFQVRAWQWIPWSMIGLQLHRPNNRF